MQLGMPPLGQCWRCMPVTKQVAASTSTFRHRSPPLKPRLDRCWRTSSALWSQSGPAVGHFANHAVKWLVDIGAAEPQLLDEDFITYADRVAAGGADPELFPRLQELMRSEVGTRTKQQMLEISIEYDLLLVPVLSVADLAVSPQLEQRGFWQEIEDSDGRVVTYPGPPLNILIDGSSLGICRRPPPQLGQHNVEVYGELGLGPNEVEQLRSEGVI